MQGCGLCYLSIMFRMCVHIHLMHALFYDPKLQIAHPDCYENQLGDFELVSKEKFLPHDRLPGL